MPFGNQLEINEQGGWVQPVVPLAEAMCSAQAGDQAAIQEVERLKAEATPEELEAANELARFLLEFEAPAVT
jgi:hypothetical protein